MTWQTYFLKQACKLLVVDYVEYTPHEQKQPKDAATTLPPSYCPVQHVDPAPETGKLDPSLFRLSVQLAVLVLEVPSTYGEFFHGNQMRN